MTRSTLFAVAGATALLSLAGGASQAWSQADAQPAVSAAATADVDPDARQALGLMGAYLRTLKGFEVTAQTTTEEVSEEGQKLQFAGWANYEVRRPNGFIITTSDDRKVRKIYYDGKSLTLYAPRMGFYARVSAPPTIRETLDVAREKYDIALPLEDLFRWGAPDDRNDELLSGYRVGYAKINGADADQFAFREEGVDWQIWIARGEKPLPLKVVITSLDDPTQPQFTAVLTWKINPVFTASAFAFKPPAGSKSITIASVQQ